MTDTTPHPDDDPVPSGKDLFSDDTKSKARDLLSIDPAPAPHSRPAPIWLLAVDVILSALLTGAVVCLIVAFFRRHNPS